LAGLAILTGLLTGLIAAGLAGGALALELAAELVEFVLGEAKSLSVVTEHGLGGAFDALTKLVEVLGDAGLEITRLVDKATAHELGTGLQLVIYG
jgi:hypothetical protein